MSTSTNNQHQTTHLVSLKDVGGPESPSLEVFTNLKHLHKSASSVGTAPTSSCPSHDGGSDWDALSTSSGSDHDNDDHQRQGGTGSRVSSPSATTMRPSFASHKLHHPTVITATAMAGMPENSWSSVHTPTHVPMGTAMLGRRASVEKTSPMYQQRHAGMRRSPTGMKQPFYMGAMGPALPLTPIHLAALAAAASHHHHQQQRHFAAATSPTPTTNPRVRPVVHPIHIGPPTDYDFRSTNGLMKCVNAIAQLPTPEELSAKHLVINELQRLVDEWMATTFPDEKETTATLLPGGSWHLKVGLFDSDLDIVALMPQFVTSDHFFASLDAFLRIKPSITKLVAMTKATVPILSFQLNGVRIDLLFARYTQNIVPKNLAIHSDEILAGMDAASIRSLSVPRVASLVLELVPNDSVFRSCLRIIRLWAKRRGLYSNKAGFLGGVSWTILVAFICQMFPKATISSIIHRFFTILSTWNWPTPILLSKPYECAGVDSACLQWCPQTNHHDRAHLMPIITPGFPAVNSSVNVNVSTLRILKEELERGKMIIDDMMAKGLSSPAVWQKLFAPAEFFVRYDHYVVLELHAKTKDELCEWANYVSSRTRKLVETLQHTSPIETIHPFPDLVTMATSNDSTSDPSELVGDAVASYFIGYTVRNPTPTSPPFMTRQRATTEPTATVSRGDDNIAKSCVVSALRYFSATELDKSAECKDGMVAKIAYCKWQDLPESIFPQGRAAAAGERARFILSKAHTTNVANGYAR